MNRTLMVTLTSIRSSNYVYPCGIGKCPDQGIMNKFLLSTLNRFDDNFVRTPGMQASFASLESIGLFHIRGTMVGRDCRIDDVDMVNRVGDAIDGLCT